jgi:THO complex subunit 5
VLGIQVGGNQWTHIAGKKPSASNLFIKRSLDEDINLVPVEDFYKNAPPSISNPVSKMIYFECFCYQLTVVSTKEMTKTDEHKLRLARLDWELNERLR